VTSASKTPAAPFIAGDATKARFFAFFVDQLLSLGLMILAAALVPPEYPGARWAVFVAVYVAYFLVLEAVWSRTPGKLFQGLVIRQLDGSPCGWRAALIRFACRIVEINPLLLGDLPAAIVILCTKRRQRIGDLLAGTVVVRSGVRFAAAEPNSSTAGGLAPGDTLETDPPGPAAAMIAHLWLGQFAPDAPADFFEERRPREDDEPLSPFAASQGETWFDYDFVEISYLDDMESVGSLVDGHSYSDTYRDAVVARAAALGIDRANVFVWAGREQFNSPNSTSGPGYQLWYLGEFESR
jgi:uncharacterized RDD family membrane protein YckC